MFDWILFVVAPVIIVGLVAVVAGGALALCAGVSNWTARKETCATVETVEATKEVAGV